MSANNVPVFTKQGDIQGGVILTTQAADYNAQNINNAVAFSADAVEGGFIQRLRCKALGTNIQTVLRVYICKPALRLASPLAAPTGTPTGTPSSSGGSLLTGNYFAKIACDDGYSGHSPVSSETASVAVTGPNGSITWNWNAVAGAKSYDIFIGPVTGGQVTKFESNTNSFVQTAMVGEFDTINGYLLNNYLFGEITLPATTIATNAATIDVDYPINVALPPGYRVVVGLGVTVAAGWSILAIGGKY